jgi:hypothetical protein
MLLLIIDNYNDLNILTIAFLIMPLIVSFYVLFLVATNKINLIANQYNKLSNLTGLIGVLLQLIYFYASIYKSIRLSTLMYLSFGIFIYYIFLATKVYNKQKMKEAE